MLIYLVPIFLFALLFLYAPVNVKIEYCRKGQDDNFQLDIYTFINVLGISIKIPYLQNRFLPLFTEFFAEIDLFFLQLKVESENKEVEEEIEWGNIQLKKVTKVLNLLFDRTFNKIVINTLGIKCKQFFWNTEYGMSNPALTGISNGFIWVFKGILVKLSYDLLTFFCEPELTVKPDFYNKKFYTRFSGIFSVVLGNIILTMLKVLLYRIHFLYIKGFFFQSR